MEECDVRIRRIRSMMEENKRFDVNLESKAVQLQAWSGPEGCRKLRFPDYITTAQDWW